MISWDVVFTPARDRLILMVLRKKRVASFQNEGVEVDLPELASGRRQPNEIEPSQIPGCWYGFGATLRYRVDAAVQFAGLLCCRSMRAAVPLQE